MEEEVAGDPPPLERIEDRRARRAAARAARMQAEGRAQGGAPGVSRLGGLPTIGMRGGNSGPPSGRRGLPPLPLEAFAERSKIATPRSRQGSARRHPGDGRTTPRNHSARRSEGAASDRSQSQQQAAAGGAGADGGSQRNSRQSSARGSRPSSASGRGPNSAQFALNPPFAAAPETLGATVSASAAPTSVAPAGGDAAAAELPGALPPIAGALHAENSVASVRSDRSADDGGDGNSTGGKSQSKLRWAKLRQSVRRNILMKALMGGSKGGGGSLRQKTGGADMFALTVALASVNQKLHKLNLDLEGMTEMERSIARKIKMRSLESLASKKSLALGAANEKDEIDELTQDHLRLLYLIDRFSMMNTERKMAEAALEAAAETMALAGAAKAEGQVLPKISDSSMTSGGFSITSMGAPTIEMDQSRADDTWVRRTPLMVMIFEGIVEGIFDYDYAPAPDVVGGRRVYMNITQEGRDDLDDLREAGCLYSLKLSSKKYQSTTAMRTTHVGKKVLREKLSAEDKEAVDELLFAKGEAKALLKVRWSATLLKFLLYDGVGYQRESSITEIESVSYVTSPYIPQSLREGGRPTTDNSDRCHMLKDAQSNIKDELDENLTLNEAVLLIGEWVPMGTNQIVALNEKLGSSERVQGGFFTSVVDPDPDSSEFVGSNEGLTSVDILDFDDTGYVNYEAEVHFAEEDGIVQVENFGINCNADGFIMYGMECNAIMHAIRDGLSLDNLSRLLVDVHSDSSAVVDNLLSPHQRTMLDLTYLNDAASRDKFNVLLAEKICKEGVEEQLKADMYMDREANENELRQVLGDTYASHDISDEQVLIVGRNGILLGGKGVREHEPLVSSYLSLMTRNMFMRSLFQRTFILADVLKEVRRLIDHHETNPNSMKMIRELLSDASSDVILLGEIQSYLHESLLAFEVPKVPESESGKRLFDILNIDASLKRLRRRVLDMRKNVSGAEGEVSALRNQADVVSEASESRVAESVRTNTKNLEDLFRSNERASASLEIMQVVLAGSLAFDIIDRTHTLYLSIGPDLGWANDWFEPVYNTPFAIFMINMAFWAALGGYLMRLMRKIGDEAGGVLAIRFGINKKIQLEKMLNYLIERKPDVEDTESDARSLIKKFSWSETDPVLWKGEPPKIEIHVDMRYGFLLKALIQVASKKSTITQSEVTALFFEGMREAGVLGSKPLDGIEGSVTADSKGTETIVDEDEAAAAAGKAVGNGDGPKKSEAYEAVVAQALDSNESGSPIIVDANIDEAQRRKSFGG